MRPLDCGLYVFLPEGSRLAAGWGNCGRRVGRPPVVVHSFWNDWAALCAVRSLDRCGISASDRDTGANKRARADVGRIMRGRCRRLLALGGAGGASHVAVDSPSQSGWVWLREMWPVR